MLFSPPPGVNLPVAWLPGNVLSYLPLPPLYPRGKVRKINDNNIAGGKVFNLSSPFHAAIWDINAMTVTLLDSSTVFGVTPGCNLTDVLDINNFNQALVSAWCPASSSWQLYYVQ